jgi:hypothetical protein
MAGEKKTDTERIREGAPSDHIAWQLPARRRRHLQTQSHEAVRSALTSTNTPETERNRMVLLQQMEQYSTTATNTTRASYLSTIRPKKTQATLLRCVHGQATAPSATATQTPVQAPTTMPTGRRNRIISEAPPSATARTTAPRLGQRRSFPIRGQRRRTRW